MQSWILPQATAYGLVQQGHDIAFLFSSLRTGYSGRYSYLAWGREDTLTGDTLDILCNCDDASELLPHWYGYIAYETVHSLESLTRTHPSVIRQPVIRFDRFRHVIRFDHENQTYVTDGVDALPNISDTLSDAIPHIQDVQSVMAHDSYIRNVEDALEHIHGGKFYQVNLTRKCEGQFRQPISNGEAFALFSQLCQVSPAPYSAYLAHQGHYIISSSPELFMSLDAGRITTRPIKGTAPRSVDAKQLHQSQKDRAENLMIVDLMRHDIARCARPGSVEVPELFAVDSFSTLHHLSSTVTAILQDDKTLVDLLRATFPPGSMTGAPKIAAMQWISEHETLQRGVYSGALGWINGNDCELSVVIRTLIAEGRHYEFQVGGGIVADSQPEAEYRETQTKAQGIRGAMGLTMNP